MKLFTTMLEKIREFNEILTVIEGGRCPVAVSGLSAVHRAHMAIGLYQKTGNPMVMICADEHEGERMAKDLSALSGLQVSVLTPRTFTFHDVTSVSRQWEHRRIGQLSAMRDCPISVVTIDGLLQRTMPPAVFDAAVCTLKIGDAWDINVLTEKLVSLGYGRCQQVEGVGQFSLRGGILDVYAPSMTNPVRVDFFGDEVDAMGVFDQSTQRRIENVEEITILPAAEVLPQLHPDGVFGVIREIDKLIARAEKQGNEALTKTLKQDKEGLEAGHTITAIDRYLALCYPQLATAVDYLPPNAMVLFSESSRLAERAKSYQWQMDEDVKTLLDRGELDGSCGTICATFQQLNTRLEEWAVAYFDSFTISTYPTPPKSLISIMAKQLPAFGQSLESAVLDLGQYQKTKLGVLVLVGGEQRALNLQTLLREQKIKSAVDFRPKTLPKQGEIIITVGGLSAGMEYPEAKLAILVEGQGNITRKPTPKKDTSNRQKLKSYADLAVTDLVVHEHHGVGRYMGMTKIATDGIEKDYVKLAYAGTDILYVPATQLDLVSKYIGGSDEAKEKKKLSKLGGAEWEKAKTKAKKAVADLAKGLILLYAERQRLQGFAFSPDTPWQKEFEDAFGFVETNDQLRCIEEIKHDMEQVLPMDRLLCGDVGYGKTEVAFRAIMKCMMDGKQAAILVPTTVLARQHFLNAIKRFQSYPVTIDVVSRFRTPSQMKETVRRVQNGDVDLLIGTHRLFQKDVRFKDLGLLVVDEEQRFGVAHKERLKENFRQVDVLTLSATPIPRTLNMALSGIRDMSTLEEPPADRQPVQTYVMEHEWGMLMDAISRELERGGQVYYLYNRVDGIDVVAGRIQRMLGDRAAVAVAHGRMSQEDIDDTMTRMTDGELNILVCTTIIETGIDLPNANTLIIEDADKLGLAQLHQIRGRVGRSNRRAYAYLTYRRGKILTEVASKRLGAIREFAEFGSGFKIAMRDLEIRGAGNILGPEQSGFLLSVGYDMYLKLLEEAVLTEQGLPIPKKAECAADLSVVASIPDRYVPSAEQRMDVYRRIAAIRNEEEADDLIDELIDRYGEPPRPVNNLISVALLRAAASGCGMTEVAQKGGFVLFSLPQFDFKQVALLCSSPAYQGRLLFGAGDKPHLSLKLKRGEDALRAAQGVVEAYIATVS